MNLAAVHDHLTTSLIDYSTLNLKQVHAPLILLNLTSEILSVTTETLSKARYFKVLGMHHQSGF